VKESSIDKKADAEITEEEETAKKKNDKPYQPLWNKEALSSAFASIVIDRPSTHRQRREKEIDAKEKKKKRTVFSSSSSRRGIIHLIAIGKRRDFLFPF
jgi:hypothetical protein